MPFKPANLAFGIAGPKPAKGFPDGRIRWRLRIDSLVVARVKTSDGIREFTVAEKDGFWIPMDEIGRNATKTLSAPRLAGAGKVTVR